MHRKTITQRTHTWLWHSTVRTPRMHRSIHRENYAPLRGVTHKGKPRNYRIKWHACHVPADDPRRLPVRFDLVFCLRVFACHYRPAVKCVHARKGCSNPVGRFAFQYRCLESVQNGHITIYTLYAMELTVEISWYNFRMQLFKHF